MTLRENLLRDLGITETETQPERTETMTRKHFEALASDIGLTLRRIDTSASAGYDPINPSTYPQVAVGELADLIATTCASTNPRFDRQRFMNRIDQVRKDGLR